MLISKEGSFIYIAVPKTGSSSIEQALSSMAMPRFRKKFNKHITAKKLKRELAPRRWNRSFKFAFVRNPYDRMYSWYRYRQRDALKDPGHRFHHRYTGDIGFNEFVHTFSEQKIMLPQSAFVCAKDQGLLLDFVGRYETLQSDFNQVCDRQEVSRQQLPRLNNSSAAEPFNPNSLDQSSIGIINDYFRLDFEMFDYEAL